MEHYCTARAEPGAQEWETNHVVRLSRGDVGSSLVQHKHTIYKYTILPVYIERIMWLYYI